MWFAFFILDPYTKLIIQCHRNPKEIQKRAEGYLSFAVSYLLSLQHALIISVLF